MFGDTFNDLIWYKGTTSSYWSISETQSITFYVYVDHFSYLHFIYLSVGRDRFECEILWS